MPAIAACGAIASTTSGPRAGTESRPLARFGATAAPMSFAPQARLPYANPHRRCLRPFGRSHAPPARQPHDGQAIGARTALASRDPGAAPSRGPAPDALRAWHFVGGQL